MGTTELLECPKVEVVPESEPKVADSVVTAGAAETRRIVRDVKIWGYTGGQVDYEAVAPALVGSRFGSIAFGERYNTEGLGSKILSRAAIDEVIENPAREVGLWSAIGERMHEIAGQEYGHFFGDLGIGGGELNYTKLFEIPREEHGPSWVDFEIKLPGLGYTELFGKKTQGSGFLLGPIGQQKLSKREEEKVRIISLVLAQADNGIVPVAVYSDIDSTNFPKNDNPPFSFHPENHTASSREHRSDVRITTVFQPQGITLIEGGKTVKINVGSSLAGSRTGAN